MINDNKEASQDLEILSQKKIEGGLMKENLLKKKEFFKNNVNELKGMIKSKEDENKRV